MFLVFRYWQIFFIDQYWQTFRKHTLIMNVSVEIVWPAIKFCNMLHTSSFVPIGVFYYSKLTNHRSVEQAEKLWNDIFLFRWSNWKTNHSYLSLSLSPICNLNEIHWRRERKSISFLQWNSKFQSNWSNQSKCTISKTKTNVSFQLLTKFSRTLVKWNIPILTEDVSHYVLSW